MPRIQLENGAIDDFAYWTTQDAKTMRRIGRLLLESSRTPFAGTGKPEPLKGGRGELWSRRIDEANRMIYRVKDDLLIVESLRGHYDA